GRCLRLDEGAPLVAAAPAATRVAAVVFIGAPGVPGPVVELGVVSSVVAHERPLAIAERADRPVHIGIRRCLLAGALGWSGGFLNARWLFVFLRLGLSGGGSGGMVTRGFLRSSGLLRRVARREVPAASAKQCECQNSDGGDEDGRLLRRFLGLFGGPGAAWAPGRRRRNAD